MKTISVRRLTQLQQGETNKEKKPDNAEKKVRAADETKEDDAEVKENGDNQRASAFQIAFN